jgi:hypothetical protein
MAGIYVMIELGGKDFENTRDLFGDFLGAKNAGVTFLKLVFMFISCIIMNIFMFNCCLNINFAHGLFHSP